MGVWRLLFGILRFGHGIFFVSLQSALMAGVFLEWRRERRARALAARKAAGQGGAEAARGKGADPAAGEAGREPLVSVLVPVHNEEGRMAGLLESLALQDYPRAEFIFVDDRSGDGSAAMLARFAAGRRNVKILTLKENPGPNHKQYALGQGIGAAGGEFLLFTDADCQVPPGWIRAMVEGMADEKTGAIIAPVFKKKEGRGFFYSYQCYDHIVRYLYLAGAAGLGAAGGGFGNNLILRRACLEAAGGYGAVPPSPTEDAALVSSIRSSTAYTVRSAIGWETHVFTGAEKSWRSFVNQTLRWNNGGLFSPEPVTRINYTVLMLIISTGIFALPLLPLLPKLWPLPAWVFIVMLENTAGSLCVARRRRLSREGAASSLPPSPLLWLPELIFMPFYMTAMTVMGYLGIKTDWKGSEVDVPGQV
ncbi:MAG: glycosyltransferase [Treponema sp.]|jgi:cellulose synthase/poly-beta-1,6-N-acetylglucosamine synthase-like glycosyltransferase|nr:glycosyltransferase [Treponema sp.]